MIRDSEKALKLHLNMTSKVIVYSAFRESLENLHAGKCCPVCAGKDEYSKISNDEMKDLMIRAVNRTYTILFMWLFKEKLFAWFASNILRHFTARWDEPECDNTYIVKLEKLCKEFGGEFDK